MKKIFVNYKKGRFVTLPLVFVMVVMVTVNCSKDDLNLTNPNALSTASFWKTADDAEKGLVACYGPLTTTQGWGRMLGAILTIHRGDDANAFSWPAVSDPGTFTVVPTDGRVGEGWGELNAIVARTNSVLAYVPTIDMDEAQKKRILGEAYFLRALAHFYLLNMWGNIPLILQPVEEVNDLFVEQAPQAEVWASIISDSKAAQASLPETVDAANVGRATWGAATAMLGKAYLFTKDWTNAAAEFKKIIDKPNLYRLVSNYQDNFLTATNNNAESIWELQYESNVNASWGTSGTPNVGRGQAYEPDIAPPAYSSQGSISVNRWVFDLFMKQKTKDGKIDPRAYATMIWNYPGAKIYQDNFKTKMTGADTNRIWDRKYLNFDRESSLVPGSWWYASNNRRMIRLADVLLMYAEARNEASGPDATAYDAINRVRARANMPDITPGLSKDAFRAAVRDERVLELALEGDRVFDLLRWGTMAEVFTKHPEYRSNSGGKFIPNKNEYLPIPFNDVSANPKLKQNPGYIN
ncbi:RagB/SusD family nutrient uptake outer membrane protein [Dyadobacter sandarakinus]|uniref:RagB/SusD family nutrient uptake outer membrane protein n=1 Tax=Dyadobacter sandarakinus TaxID=2747268 RepID=A0ABX7I3P4_9BACT|nr:RagB/SusD family nutrient uptake outer membrane protein [Dyadobacter sandarakinus]QRR00691.1 RagB/SusD family nutrient uptake outer membrane protein [Dyadobacter sandarakinus]